MKTAFAIALTLLAACGASEPSLPSTDVAELLVFSGPGDVLPVSLATNSLGHRLIVGRFSSAVSFGGVELSSRSTSDLFLFELDVSNAPVWARSIDQTQFGFDGGRACARADGGWWLGGRSIRGPTTLDDRAIPQFDLPQAMLLQLDVAGQVERVWTSSASQGSRISAVATHPEGVVIAGRFSGDFVFDGASYSSADSDIFAGVLNDRHEVVVSAVKQGPGLDVVTTVNVVDAEAHIGGWLTGELGPLTAVGRDGYVWSLKSDQLELVGGPGEQVVDYAVDGWLAGRLDAPLDADPAGTNGDTRDDVFVGRGDQFFRLAGPGLERNAGLVMSPGGVTLAGTYEGGAGIGAERLPSPEVEAAFVLRVDDDGFQLSAPFAGSDAHRAAGLAATTSRLLLLGGFDGVLRFGQKTERASGNRDVFLLSLPR